ncbi:XdhC family protein [Pyrobaculum sp.]|uniref:XdhC family protein n=1 Tax=Pyrobaculum sp. TaxID=2004705 RepID=UPI0031819246
MAHAVSVCDVLRALDVAARLGPTAVLVRAYDGRRWVVDIVADGRALLGFLPSSVVRELPRLEKQGERFEGKIGDLYVSAEVVLVRPTLVVVGFGEVAKKVSQVATAAGFNVVAIGHRSEAAQHSGGLEELGDFLWEGSAVVIANEGGHPSDVDVAELALRRGAGYVALLASQKRAALVIRELERRGIPPAEIDKRLRSPAGLDIGAKTAGEIAVSIVAEVVMYFRGGTGKPMREVKNPRSVALGEGEDLSKYRCEWRPPS